MTVCIFVTFYNVQRQIFNICTYLFILVVGNGAGGVALNYGIKNTLKKVKINNSNNKKSNFQKFGHLISLL